MFMRPHKFGLTSYREVIESWIGFENMFKPNKPLKLAVLVLLGDFSAKISIN